MIMYSYLHVDSVSPVYLKKLYLSQYVVANFMLAHSCKVYRHFW